jgi:branched-chain amino acid transport system substrate-binding protein
MVAVGLQAKMMAPDGCREDAFIQAAGAENVNGRAFVTFGGVPPDQMTGKGKEFVDAYRKKFGGEPEAYAVYGYVGMKTALDVLGKVGKKDREAVRAAMEQYAIQDGALGSWKFDANGDTTLTVMSGSIVEAGKFKFATLLGDTPTAPSGAMPNEASPSAVAPAATPTTP